MEILEFIILDLKLPLWLFPFFLLAVFPAHAMKLLGLVFESRIIKWAVWFCPVVLSAILDERYYREIGLFSVLLLLLFICYHHRKEQELKRLGEQKIFNLDVKLQIQETDWNAIDEKYRFQCLSSLPKRKAKRLEHADLSQCGEFQEWYREQVIIPNSGGVYGNKLYRMYKERPAENE